jgi:hypothetical protein
MLFHRAGHGIAHHLDRQFGQIAGLAGNARATAFGPCQRQQLVHGVRGADAGAPDVLQRALEFFRARALALRQVGLHAQARQRRFELVGGVGQKALLRGQRLVQPREQVIHRRHQRRHLQRHGAVVQGREVVGLRARMRCSSWFSG